MKLPAVALADLLEVFLLSKVNSQDLMAVFLFSSYSVSVSNR